MQRKQLLGIDPELSRGHPALHHPVATVGVAEHGSEALALVDDWQPDVLVLDAHLPDMNGFDLLARLRGCPGLASVPAFMCSADAMPEDLQRARSSGFAGYWVKPIDIAAVLRDLRGLPRP